MLIHFDVASRLDPANTHGPFSKSIMFHFTWGVYYVGIVHVGIVLKWGRFSISFHKPITIGRHCVEILVL